MAIIWADALWGDAAMWPMLIGYMVASFGLMVWTRLPPSAAANGASESA